MLGISEEAIVEIGAVILAAALAAFGWLIISHYRSVARRLESLEEEVKELRRQAANHDHVTAEVAAIVKGLATDHQRLDASVTRIEDRLIDHLVEGND